MNVTDDTSRFEESSTVEMMKSLGSELTVARDNLGSAVAELAEFVPAELRTAFDDTQVQWSKYAQAMADLARAAADSSSSAPIAATVVLIEETKRRIAELETLRETLFQV